MDFTNLAGHILNVLSDQFGFYGHRIFGRTKLDFTKLARAIYGTAVTPSKGDWWIVHLEMVTW